MTTDPIRDEAVKVLAEALHAEVRRVALDLTEPWPPTYQTFVIEANRLLDASPTLARRLALGTAWDAAVASLPDGWRMQAVYMAAESIDDERWCATAYGPEDLEWVDPKRGEGPTPELALAALAAKLGSGK